MYYNINRTCYNISVKVRKVRKVKVKNNGENNVNN